MDMGFTADQHQFRETVARFLQDKSPPTTVRKLMATEAGYDTAVWRQLTGELGLAGTHLPEDYGGFGFGPVELGIICEEMGRHLYCGPHFASAVMAGYAVLLGATEANRTQLLPDIASGGTIATLVLDNVGDATRVGESITARDDARLTGQARIVLDAHVANLLIVAAATAEGLALFTVAPDAPGVAITPLQGIDSTRKLNTVVFDDTPADRISRTPLDIADLWDHLSVALAHEMMGGAQRLFDTTLDYLKMRVQFGRTIGSFQALKHRCADLLTELELAKAATYAAARYLTTGDGERYSPHMAKAMAGDAYMAMARQAIQLRGGIGFTWEEDTHLWFKRAKSSEVFLGTPDWHRERMMQQLEATHG
ncbi:MAG: acyl-CoA/acyl-ACP dehydrogenase [Pseudomonadales bacterium]|nr:acyl-CoA/acyl-ACP dehydrogenase [Pseudomonadales bacterium]